MPGSLALFEFTFKQQQQQQQQQPPQPQQQQQQHSHQTQSLTNLYQKKTTCASVFACIFCNLRERGCLINASTGINIKEIPQFIGIGGFLS